MIRRLLSQIASASRSPPLSCFQMRPGGMLHRLFRRIKPLENKMNMENTVLTLWNTKINSPS